MAICETTDFLYPMKADIYYPLIKQTQYGQATKDWIYDIKPETFLQYENKLIARVKADPRTSSTSADNAISNILVTNIRFEDDSLLYKETAGPRSGRGTIYEVATVEPFTGPFGSIEYYKVLLRRTENQTVGD